MEMIETRSEFVWMDPRGFFRVVAKPQIDLTLDDAKEIVRACHQLSGGQPHPILVDLTALRSMSREARNYFAGPETAKIQSVAALLTRSPISNAIGNFFLGLNKPVIPTRLFTTEEAALEWLRPHLA